MLFVTAKAYPYTYMLQIETFLEISSIWITLLDLKNT